jgi:hypothetical protein
MTSEKQVGIRKDEGGSRRRVQGKGVGCRRIKNGCPPLHDAATTPFCFYIVAFYTVALAPSLFCFSLVASCRRVLLRGEVIGERPVNFDGLTA